MADVELVIQSIIDELERDGGDAKNKTEDKKEKRLRGPAVTKLYESGS